MKKLICLLLALLMAFASASMAEIAVEESAPLTREEIDLFLTSLGQAALEEGNVKTTVYDDGLILAAYSGGELQIADEELTETTAVLGAYLSEEASDLRGLYLGSALDEVLAAYPNDNPSLGGTYYDAALFIAGEKPEISAGYLLRSGQQAASVVYSVYSWQPDGVAVSDVTYTLVNGCVEAILVRSSRLLEEAEALENIQEIADMQEISEYFAYPHSAENGEALAPFEREDLTLLASGQTSLDFLDLTAEELTQAFGPANVDEWTEDSDGAFLRLMQWDGVSALLQYDAQRQFAAIDSLTVNDDALDGPRGVRVGDMLDSVLYRFRHAEIFHADDTIPLYGDGQALPYGVLAYTPESAEVSYAFSLEDGRAVVWHMTFVTGELQSMTLMLR